jgi:hypothetical protein
LKVGFGGRRVWMEALGDRQSKREVEKNQESGMAFRRWFFGPGLINIENMCSI